MLSKVQITDRLSFRYAVHVKYCSHLVLQYLNHVVGTFLPFALTADLGVARP